MSKKVKKVLSLAIVITIVLGTSGLLLSEFVGTTFIEKSYAATGSYDISVQYECGSTTATSSSIKPNLKICNDAQTVDMSKITLRYWFDNDGLTPTALIRYAEMGEENVNVTIKPSYAEISFSSETGTLGSNDQTLKFTIRNSENSNYDQTNDYSFDPSKDSYENYEKIALYIDGELVWGYEPDGGTGTIPEPTQVPTPTPNNSTNNIIFENDIDSMPLGIASDDDIKSYWDTRYSKGADEGRIEVVTGGPNNNSGKMLKVKYPANAHQTADSGATWETNLRGDYDELYMSYWVKFDPNFEWVQGGKLPGLAGMESPFPDNGDSKFRIRLMWREDGKVEFYLHDYSLLNLEGEVPYRHWWDLGGQHYFVKGQWHHIEIHVKLNTPGQLDGVLEGWFDEELAFKDTNSNVGVRGVGEDDRLLNYMFFSSFFGGSSPPVEQWEPDNDCYIYFDDFKISTTRIGLEN